MELWENELDVGGLCFEGGEDGFSLGGESVQREYEFDLGVDEVRVGLKCLGEVLL